MQLRNVRFIVRKSPAIQIVSHFESFKSVVACHPVFEALFKDVSTGFGLRIVEKCLENALGKVCSAFQNLRLGWLN